MKETIEKGKKYWNFGNISLTMTTAALLLRDNGSKFGNIVALSYTLKRTKKDLVLEFFLFIIMSELYPSDFIW